MKRSQMSSLFLLNLFGLLLLLAGCALQSNSLAPVEEEQIKNVVEDFFIRQNNVPDYEATIEEVAGNWARVSITPVGVEVVGEPAVLYLQNQAEATNEAPTAVANVQPGNTARVTTSTGWVIVLGPQVHFTNAELDSAGVPPQIRS
jgi:hypothetical protein